MTQIPNAFVMTHPGIVATLDRRIKLDHETNGSPAIDRISQLAAHRYVVLLSEPGMGKSTVLEQQAQSAGGHFTDVRWFIDGDDTSIPVSVPLFLDSLDEYRSDRTSAVEKLAARLRAGDAPSWWLSCRAADWRASDLAVLTRATNGDEIVVATLMPLESDEADQILEALITRQKPSEARERAQALAARAFLQNPLSLKLLVNTGLATGPKSRFELFDEATEQLAHEFDDRRPVNPGRSPGDILATASRLCALLLLANRAAIWHLNCPAPRHGDAERYLAANTLQVPSPLLGLTLDSPLFQRNSDGAFAPMHRAIAEFLAGRALACAVAGEMDRPRMPLGRILALMTTGGRPPTDLRGTYAWTAVHLSRLGRHGEALRLIQQDPVSVLLYGDAAVLTEGERKELWLRLDQDDPWFLANQDGDTAIGGLAGDDLATDFEWELRQPDRATHRFFAVTEALRYGPPVARLRPVLYDITLDSQRPDHERIRAAEAWLAGEPDALTGRLALFRACSALPASDGHTLFCLRLAGELLPDALSDAELDRLLADYAGSQEDNVAGRLWKLSRKLQQTNRPALLARDWHTLLESESFRGPTHEVRRVLDQILAGALVASPAPSGESVRQWLVNIRQYPVQNVPDAVRDAIQQWLRADPKHSLELLAAIAEAQKMGSEGWPVSEFWLRCGVLPPSETAIALVDPGSDVCKRLGAPRCRAMAVELAMQSGTDPSVRSVVIERLLALPRAADFDNAIDVLQNGRPKDPAVLAHEKSQAAYVAEQEQRVREVVGEFRSSVAALSDGSAVDLLSVAARYRFGNDLDYSTIEPGFDRVIELVGDDVAHAIEAGWTRAAKTLALGPVELGQHEAPSQPHPVEPLVLAGIDRILATDPPASRDLPIAAALVALKSGAAWAHNDRPAEERLLRWALEHLARTGADGCAALAAFWQAALENGARFALAGAWLLAKDPQDSQFAAPALLHVLGNHPDMESNVLHPLLTAAAGILTQWELLALADALQLKSVTGESRDLWLCAAFALSPAEWHGCFVETFTGRADELSEHYDLIERIAKGFATQRILIAKGILEVCARGKDRDVFRGGAVARANLDWLQNSADPLARIALEQLPEDRTLESAWREDFRHALAGQARQLADEAFAPLSPAAIEAAMSAGAPANAADLFAVVVEQLRLIQDEMQSGALNSWESYWNEKPPAPKTENPCRNVLARELQARVRHFGIEIPLLPEAQRAAETRADLLVISTKGRNLPLEAKRHWHEKVWTAAGTQLQGYAADVGSDPSGSIWSSGLAPGTNR